MSNMNIEILHIHEDLPNNDNFYLKLLNGDTKFWKLMAKMSEEELNVSLKSFCMSAKKKDGTLSVYKSSSMKSI